jgi:diacylglycerol kinase (ATP)
MNEKPSDDLNRLIKAFGYSVEGLKAAMKQPAFRIEVWAASFMAPLAIVLGDTASEMSLMIGSLLLVLIVELLNTGIEKVTDRVSSEWHELSKQAKDVASAAVLLSIANALIVWLIVLVS